MEYRPQGYLKNIISYALLGVILSFSLPWIVFLLFGGNLQKEVNPTIVNGLLTVTSIVFGFAVFELRETRTSIQEKFLISFPLLCLMFITVLMIVAGLVLDNVSMAVTLEVAGNCLFNIFYIFPVIIAKEKYNKKG